METYNILVESLKRLYELKSLNLLQIKERLLKGTINEQEYRYITGLEYSE